MNQMNQPVPKHTTTSFSIFSGKIFFLFNDLKISTNIDLIENFKSETLFCKMSISKRLRCAMLLRNGNDPKCKKTKTFSTKNERNGIIFFIEQ